ncbi:tyrosine-protein kinase STYK1-like isoform X2 [Hyperolius riggenbachi]|uniref:tyrosine-protein kinase STYK1-like isoform X2 n=1 Tax=Hyperolius riggenbachi TaxID=752182 RepID=UPI0035A36542
MNSSEDIQHTENGWQDSVIIIPALLSASTLLVVAVIVWKFIQGRRVKGREVEEQTADDTNGWAVNTAGEFENSLTVPEPVLEKKQLPQEWRLHDRIVLCRGHYGPISQAMLVHQWDPEDRRGVILKELSENCSPGEIQDFMDLLKFHEQVCRHENLVRMLWCQTQRRPVCLIMEAMTFGNLLNFLRDLHEEALLSLTERDVYSLAMQVASGLEFLSGTHNLVHGYVAACNVLIHEDMSVRLCGLGLTAVQYRTGSIPIRRATRVPVKWQSPERLKEGSVTEKSDVWSFGILLYELVTLGAPPYLDVSPQELPNKLHKNYRMKRPQQCGERLFDFICGGLMKGLSQKELTLSPQYLQLH